MAFTDKANLQKESAKVDKNEISIKIPCCGGSEMSITYKTNDLGIVTDAIEKLFLAMGVNIDMVTVRKGGGGTP